MPASDGVVLVKQKPDGDRKIDNEIVSIDGEQRYRQRIADPRVSGAWAYRAGASGTVNVPAGARVLAITCVAAAAGATLTINGGDAIPVPIDFGLVVGPRGNLVAPALVFAGTSAFFVEFVA